MESGDLRHIVDFQKRVTSRDAVTGEMIVDWQNLYTDVHAAIQPMSDREYLAAAAVQSEATTRIVVRQRQIANAMDPKTRVVHGHKCCKWLGRELYNPEGMTRDKDTGWEFVSIRCSKGVDEGG
jgi:SPP1 family predicted phage head-tail adaptor